jgi:hypothetical protein
MRLCRFGCARFQNLFIDCQIEERMRGCVDGGGYVDNKDVQEMTVTKIRFGIWHSTWHLYTEKGKNGVHLCGGEKPCPWAFRRRCRGGFRWATSAEFLALTWLPTRIR